MTPIEKKILAIALAAVILSTGCIGYLIFKENNKGGSDPGPEPEPEPEWGEVHYKITGMEITDSCPRYSKSKDIIMKEFEQKDNEYWTFFTPFNEEEYKWVKLTVEFEIINSYMYFCEDYEKNTKFYPTCTVTGTGEVTHYTGYRPANIFQVYTDGYQAYTRVEHECGTVDVWYLFPPIWNGSNGYGPGAIPWSEVTLDMIPITIYGGGKVTPMD